MAATSAVVSKPLLIQSIVDGEERRVHSNKPSPLRAPPLAATHTPAVLITTPAASAPPAAGGENTTTTQHAAQDDASQDGDWHTVTVADNTCSAEDFLATLKKDLKQALASSAPRMKLSPMAGPVDLGVPLARHSSIVPNTVLVRLALLEPFMRGATVFDPSHNGATSIWLNGQPMATFQQFREKLQTTLAECIDDAGERHTTNQILTLLVHAKFSKLCVDAAKLAFAVPNFRLQQQTVDVTCTRQRVGYRSTGRLLRTMVHQAATSQQASPMGAGAVPLAHASTPLHKRTPSATLSAMLDTGDLSDSPRLPVSGRGATDDDGIGMSVSWSVKPLCPTSDLWSSFTACFSALSTCPNADESNAEDTAAVVTFDFPIRR
jgi:hypothetical protein